MAVSPLCRQHGRSLEKEGTPMWLCRSPEAGGSGLRRVEVGTVRRKVLACLTRLPMIFGTVMSACDGRSSRPRQDAVNTAELPIGTPESAICLYICQWLETGLLTESHPLKRSASSSNPTSTIRPDIDSIQAPSQTFSRPLLLSSLPSYRPSIQRFCSHII